MYDEWRLRIEILTSGVDLERLVQRVYESTPEDVEVHRRGKNEVLVYAQERESNARRQKGLRRLLTAERTRATLELTRWNPGQERWQDPSWPVEPPRHALEPAWLELSELAWEVRLRFPNWFDRRKVELELRDEGHALVSDGWRRLTVGVADEGAARSLARDLAKLAPSASIEHRRMSRWRRWLVRQGLSGNYGESSGNAGLAGDGGGGNGG